MAGHSKWANIKRKKAKTDVARAKVWNKLLKEITVAAKLGGGDPDANPRLRAAILKGRGQSLPMKNIEGAIDKAVGNTDANNMEEPMYEGYGPEGTAILVKCMTDNRTRTVAEVRNAFNKNGGNMGEPGSVAWGFAHQGVIIIDASVYEEEQVMDVVLEAGALDMTSVDGVFEVITEVEQFNAVSAALENAKIDMLSAELAYNHSTPVQLEGESVQVLMKLIEKLEDLDDVQDVYHNAEFDD
ncbi:MAG: YebC/PmpR family DNA-binding transcriptional regulator [Fibrobacter sp.]|mgnify:CR=1 FL=1|nr:YebC/PmpR family DNA-binding transcriptional regulator [Fibrobacter sp.]